MSYEFGAIDAVCNFEFSGVGVERPAWSKKFLTGKIGADGKMLGSFTVEAFIEKMDRAGVEHAFLIAVKSGSTSHKIHRRVPYDKVAEIVRKYPARFSGLAGTDPTEGKAGLDELERAVKELGFVGAHLYPHWFEQPPDHAGYYPIYETCQRLGVPIQMQVGNCLRYSDERPLPSVGRPITLDRIAIDFPALKVVGIHIGWPWTEEMIAMAWKHPNVYIGCDAYAPKHWPPSFVHYINSWGKRKVIFGTDFPVIDPERARAEIEQLGFREDAKRLLLRNNVIDLYGLKLPKVAMPAKAEADE